MASFIHGFRVFDVVKCYRTKELVLSGMQGQHLHNRVQKPATCNGISSAMWLTDKAKERLKSREKHDPEECPNWDCTCGAYFYRTLEKAWHSSHNIYAHVVCLEHTIIHKDGGRTNRYGVDYLLAPEKDDQKVYVALLEGEEMPPDQKDGVMYDSGLKMGHLPIPIVEYSMKEVMNNHVRQPAGNIEIKGEPKVTLLSELDTVEKLNAFIVQGGFEGQVVKLEEVADITRGYVKNKSINKVNGNEAIILRVIKNTSYGILEALESAAGFIGINASKKVVMRFFPVLTFKLDTTVDEQMKIDGLIEKIHQEEEHRDDVAH